MAIEELVSLKQQWQKPVLGTMEGDVVRLMKATQTPYRSLENGCNPEPNAMTPIPCIPAMVCGPCPCGPAPCKG